MGNIYSYMRISTREERQRQSYSRQEAALRRYAQENGLEYLLEFKEDESGRDFTHRKEWNRLERLLQSGDTVVCKDISRFTREAENGYDKYMWLLNRGVELIFLDNMTISTPYIRRLLQVAQQQDLVARTSLESTVKLLLLVELDRAEQERSVLIRRIRDGIAASSKPSGRKKGQVDKLSPALEADIREYLQNRSIRQTTLMVRHGISRNTLKKYIAMVSGQSAADRGGEG